MHAARFSVLPLLSGMAMASAVFLVQGQKTEPATPGVEYRILEDVQAEDLGALVQEGWEFAGYLGLGVKGVGNDETLWKRTKR